MTTTFISQLRRPASRSLTAAVMVCALTLSACGGSFLPPGTATSTPATTSTSGSVTTTDPPPGTTPPGTTTSDPTAEPGTPVSLQPLGDPDALRKENQESQGAGLDVTGVRLAAHDTFDRVVFDLAGTGSPGWVTEYNLAPVEQGSGFPIDYEGGVALDVHLLGLNKPVTAAGVEGVGGVVTEVLPGINHHGTSHFVIGLERETAFSVTLLTEPSRLVIDILHDPVPQQTHWMGSPTLAPKNRAADQQGHQMLTGMRFASHQDFDRVVLDLEGTGNPEWNTDFNPDPRGIGSGLPIYYQGDTTVEIRLTGVTPFDEDGNIVYPDLDRIPGAGGVVTEVIPGSPFEGQVLFFIGLEHQTPYSVTLLEQPTRIVIDLLH